MVKTVDEIAEELRGTCDSLQAVLEKNDMDGADDDLEFCHALDNLVFCCEICSWWCEQSEMADDPAGRWICEDCGGDE